MTVNDLLKYIKVTNDSTISTTTIPTSGQCCGAGKSNIDSRWTFFKCLLIKLLKLKYFSNFLFSSGADKVILPIKGNIIISNKSQIDLIIQKLKKKEKFRYLRDGEEELLLDEIQDRDLKDLTILTRYTYQRDVISRLLKKKTCLKNSFSLRCFQRLFFTNVATRRCFT